MALYDAFIFDPATRSKTPLGRVRGRNHPAAWLRACAKYRVPAERQRRLGVEPVVPPPPPPPISDTDRAVMRALTGAMNAAVRQTIKGKA